MRKANATGIDKVPTQFNPTRVRSTTIPKSELDKLEPVEVLPNGDMKGKGYMAGIHTRDLSKRIAIAIFEYEQKTGKDLRQKKCDDGYLRIYRLK